MYEAWLPLEVKQKMAMFAGGASGVMCLVGGAVSYTHLDVYKRQHHSYRA